jgi:hypothetical protein
MDFLKKHYEKVLLGLVLIGLAVAVAVLPFFISSEQQKLRDITSGVLNPRVTLLTNIDMSGPEQALKRMATPAFIDFGPPNRLFNPMPWQKATDGKLIAGTRVGPTSLVVTNITPLYLKLTLDKIDPGTPDSGPKYVIGIENAAALQASHRTKKQTYCTLNPPSKNETFSMVEVKGKLDDPTQIIVELRDTGEKAVITKDQPFKRVDGYTVDMHYDLEKKSWTAKRVGSLITFNGEDYNIVAINQNEVVLAAKVNGKKWTIKANSSAPS